MGNLLKILLREKFDVLTGHFFFQVLVLGNKKDLAQSLDEKEMIEKM